MHIILYIICFGFGACVGLLLAALCTAAGEADRRSEVYYYDLVNKTVTKKEDDDNG